MFSRASIAAAAQRRGPRVLVSMHLATTGRACAVRQPLRLQSLQWASLHVSTPRCDSGRDTSVPTIAQYFHRAFTANQSRAIFVQKLPQMATEADVRAFFEKRGFSIETMYMAYRSIVMRLVPSCVVILTEPTAKVDALNVLRGNMLLGRELHLAGDLVSTDLSRAKSKMDGWSASPEPDFDAQWRGMLTSPLQDTVDSVLQGKVLGFYNLPSPEHISRLKLNDILYEKLHAYNVEGFSSRTYKPSENPKVSGWVISILFATKEEADQSQAALDGQIIRGYCTRARNSLTSYQNLSRDKIRKHVHGKWDRSLWGPLEEVV